MKISAQLIVGSKSPLEVLDLLGVYPKIEAGHECALFVARRSDGTLWENVLWGNNCTCASFLPMTRTNFNAFGVNVNAWPKTLDPKWVKFYESARTYTI